MGSNKDDHRRRSKDNKFCCLRAFDKCDLCEHPKNYRDACEPTNPPWHYYEHLRLITYKKYPDLGGLSEALPYSHEAHHILCTDSVQKIIFYRSDIRSIIRETKWCINGERNMLAMPIWGQTIQWYCDLETETLKENGMFVVDEAGQIEKVYKIKASKPNFKNIPMHNFGHSGASPDRSYKKEVEVKIQEIADLIAKSKAVHEKKIRALRKELESASDDFRELLKDRGIRKGGTHKGWQIGMKDRRSSSGWYEPFSMAKRPREITFPMRGSFQGEMGRKFEKLVKAYKWVD